ncbi:MAG: hypothetical protein HKM28_02535, partial [Flavobacteriaceae bacterium]|nr:hypothetical protein [Flavobacteriaceae bacterium]
MNSNYRSIVRGSLSLAVLYVLVACSSLKLQQKNIQEVTPSNQTPTHTFYIAGGMGNKANNVTMLTRLSEELQNASENSTLLWVGDYTLENTPPNEANKQLLKKQLSLLNNFEGYTYFVPGDYEWSSRKTKEIEWVEDHIKDNDLENVEVEPNNVCPLEYREITEDLSVLFVDSQWYIANWDRVEDINRKCTDIVTRRRFIEELEGYIKDTRGKNLVIVMHHPIFSNGMYAAHYMGGASPKKVFFERYRDLQIQVSALVQELDRATIVSGHEESLQLLTSGKTRQIISGSLSDAAPTKRSSAKITAVGGELEYEGKFTYGEEGYAKLMYFQDGSSQVTFVTKDLERSFPVTTPLPDQKPVEPLKNDNDRTVTVPVVTDPQKLNKSGFYKFIWGDRYRHYFGVPVTAPVGVLSNMKRGLKVEKEGGGHQSYSSRLQDADGRDYAMRGLEKNALKFLRFRVKGISYTEDDFKGTFAETAVYDFFTTTHPFMQLIIDPLAESVNVNHASTELYYLPKQPGFEKLDDAYGDQLYFIEERPNDEQKDFPGYNRANPSIEGEIFEFESSTDMFEKIKEDEKYSVDQRAYIRARLFDMLIGDWDRHEDQWRWGAYKISDDDIRFVPVPRDRDAAFSKFDGIAIPLIQLFLPDVRFWQSYDSEIDNVKWFNGEGNNIDRAIINKHDSEVWVEEARYIQQYMTDEVIDQAFKKLPSEVQDSASEDIQLKLKGRLQNLDKIAEIYGDYLNKTVAIHGTQKDDIIEITRLPEGKTHVQLKRNLKDEENTSFFERTFNHEETKEIWIYGLDDDDQFVITGEGSNPIMIRIIGGYGSDVYEVSNRSNIKVYDWRHEKSKFEDKTPSHQFTNVYETNTFHWRQFRENSNILLPNIGFRTDDGLFVGASDTYTNYGFNGNPFRYRHQLSANYYFKFQAIELEYEGTFANVLPRWNLAVGGYFTNDSFANNFFGYGNESQYDPDTFENEFHRARTQQIRGNIGLVHKFLRFDGIFESFKVIEDDTRFINDANVNDEVFEMQNYIGGQAMFEYRNENAADFPTKARYLGITAGFKSNIEGDNNQFAYGSVKIGWQEKLIASGDLVLGTSAEVKSNFGDLGEDYYFYHAPSLGGNNGLRGYRNERFTGETYFYQSTDLKLRVARLVTA